MSRFEDINNRIHNDALMNDEFMNFIETHFSELEIFPLQQGTMDLVWIWKAWLDVKNSSGEDERPVDQVLSQQIMNTKKSFSFSWSDTYDTSHFQFLFAAVLENQLLNQLVNTAS